jgi:hypothetical protein
MLLSFYLFAIQTAFGGIVEEKCQENREKTAAILVAELEIAGCHDCSIESNNPIVKNAMESAAKVIESLKSNNPEVKYQNDLNLERALKLARDEKLYGPRSQDSRVDLSNPLTKALFNLHAKYLVYSSLFSFDTIEKEYIDDLNNILRLTDKGREMLDCFEKKREGIEPVVTTKMGMIEMESGNVASHRVYRDAPNRYRSVISLRPTFPPVEVLGSYVHELTHACNVLERIQMDKLVDRLKLINQKMAEPNIDKARLEELRRLQEADMTAWDHWAALDEVKAFSNETKIYQEFVNVDPIHVCSLPLEKFYFQPEEKLYSEHLENAFSDGSLPRKIIARYLVKAEPQLKTQHSFFKYADTKLIPGENPSIETVKSFKWLPEFKTKVDELLRAEGWAPAN